MEKQTVGAFDIPYNGDITIIIRHNHKCNSIDNIIILYIYIYNLYIYNLLIFFCMQMRALYNDPSGKRVIAHAGNKTATQLGNDTNSNQCTSANKDDKNVNKP